MQSSLSTMLTSYKQTVTKCLPPVLCSVSTLSITTATQVPACRFTVLLFSCPECIAVDWSWRKDSWIANYKRLLAGAQRANFSTILSRTASTTPTPSWRCKEAFNCIFNSIVPPTSTCSSFHLFPSPLLHSRVSRWQQTETDVTECWTWILEVSRLNVLNWKLWAHFYSIASVEALGLSVHKILADSFTC